ncbi:MAG: hypothetical protein LBC87_11290 [Fibromonadaceae bacterium]|jgi:hypothetical protein|nr:hypothetical protein [Fibromonadaceae bacterium]
MKKVIIIIFLFAFCARAQEASTDTSDTSIVSIKRENLFLTLVSWPFEYIIQPTVEFLIYPVIPPLIYVSREDIIEKVANLITYGEKKNIVFYPTTDARLGSAANIGFAYWHTELFFDNDNMFFSPHRYINGDWDAAIRYKKNGILGTSFYSRSGASYKEYGNNSFINSEGTTYFYADSSVLLNSSFGFSLSDIWDLEFGVNLNFYRFNFPSLEETPMDDDEYILNRGFYKNFESYPITFALLCNTLDEPYSATKGYKFSVSYSYVPVSSYGGTRDHNYHVAESRYVHYLLLGHRSYAMTVAESNANREKLKNLSFSEAIEILSPINGSINAREVMLDRRVLITQLKARYMIEDNKGKAPFTAMGRLGGNFPLRAYSDGSFSGAIVAGLSNEYRWPIDRYADMLIFNEYGIYSDDYGHFSSFNLRNSYGFGFRVRTPKLFISRFALAFHGLQGISVILTTKPEYD